MSSSILATAISRPRLVVLVTCKYSGGFCIVLESPKHRHQSLEHTYCWRCHALVRIIAASGGNIFSNVNLRSPK